MARIDELIAAMLARHADTLILASDQPAQLNFGGVPADGAIVSASLLRAMLSEIVPPEHSDRLRSEGAFEFSYACKIGLMRVQVERHGLDFHIVITPYSSTRVFVPPVENKPTYRPYQPAVDSSLAAPAYPIYTHTLPGYGSAPFVSGGGAPNAPNSNAQNPPAPTSNFPAPLPRPSVSNPHTTSAKAPQTAKSVGFLSILVAMIVFWFLLSALLPMMGTYWWAFMLALASGVALDAHLLGVRPGLLGGWAGKMGAASWFLVCLLCGFIGVPAYLAARPVYKSVVKALASTSRKPQP